MILFWVVLAISILICFVRWGSSKTESKNQTSVWDDYNDGKREDDDYSHITDIF